MDLKRVKLKPKSVEFADDEDIKRHGEHPPCDMPGCNEPAPHRCPKSRGLNEYYYFCLEHAQDYNRAWNFFDGMSDADVQQHMQDNIYGHRPTWNYASSPDMADHLRARAQGFRDFENDDEHEKKQEEKREQQKRRIFAQTAETEAMSIMGLEPPLSQELIKSRYKELAKKYHPDLNKNDKTAEEQFKKVNMAYTVLKLAYEKYSELSAD
jgi:hypothetical protein